MHVVERTDDYYKSFRPCYEPARGGHRRRNEIPPAFMTSLLKTIWPILVDQSSTGRTGRCWPRYAWSVTRLGSGGEDANGQSRSNWEGIWIAMANIQSVYHRWAGRYHRFELSSSGVENLKTTMKCFISENFYLNIRQHRMGGQEIIPSEDI